MNRKVETKIRIEIPYSMEIVEEGKLEELLIKEIPNILKEYKPKVIRVKGKEGKIDKQSILIEPYENFEDVVKKKKKEIKFYNELFERFNL